MDILNVKAILNCKDYDMVWPESVIFLDFFSLRFL